MKRGVIIVAGGSGRRMGSEKPKQYLDLEGKPVIIHTLERFLAFDAGIQVVLVIASGHQRFWDEICTTFHYGSGIRVAQGGRTRYDSVKSGLQFVDDATIVGIHDAVRPLVSQDTLKRCYEAASLHGSGIPVTAVEETLRMTGKDGRSMHLDRSAIRRVQTPQVFKSEMIKKAYNRPYSATFTDDASLFESLFREVKLVDGNTENIKITGPADLQLASILIRSVV